MEAYFVILILGVLDEIIVTLSEEVYWTGKVGILLMLQHKQHGKESKQNP